MNLLDTSKADGSQPGHLLCIVLLTTELEGKSKVQCYGSLYYRITKKKKEYTALLKTTKGAVSIINWAQFMVFLIIPFYNLFHAGNVKSDIRVPQGSFANKLNCVYI